MAPAQLAFEATIRRSLPLFLRHVRQLLGHPGTLGLDLPARGLQIRHMVVSPRHQSRHLRSTQNDIVAGELFPRLRLLFVYGLKFTHESVTNRLVNGCRKRLRPVTATLANPGTVNDRFPERHFLIAI